MPKKTELDEKLEEFFSYVDHWPYSPYYDIEYKELAKKVRELRAFYKKKS